MYQTYFIVARCLMVTRCLGHRWLKITYLRFNNVIFYFSDFLLLGFFSLNKNQNEMKSFTMSGKMFRENEWKKKDIDYFVD